MSAQKLSCCVRVKSVNWGSTRLLLPLTELTWVAAMQREEPVAIVGRTVGQRHKADVQSGRRRRHEGQQYVGQQTTGLPTRIPVPRPTGPS